VICSILGIPQQDHQTIRHWVDASLTIDPLNPPDQNFLQRTGTLYMYILDYIKEKRQNPTDDMLSQLIEIQVDEGDETRPLSDDEIAGFSLLIASAGAETVTKLLGSTAYLLDKNPDQWAKLKANPGLISKTVDEANRYFAPSQYQGRHAMKDVSLHGVDIPAGSGVVLITAAATRDERQFADPDKFDIERDVPVQISFGHGIHYCLGVYLAKMESRIAIETLIERWPNFAIDHDNSKRVRMSNVAGFCNLPMSVA
jgi:cytochrome P450